MGIRRIDDICEFEEYIPKGSCECELGKREFEKLMMQVEEDETNVFYCIYPKGIVRILEERKSPVYRLSLNNGISDRKEEPIYEEKICGYGDDKEYWNGKIEQTDSSDAD